MDERLEMYEQLIKSGYEPGEAWELIAEMDFASDYEE